ncbi:hypothetical protein FGO68_gene13930 [Halteria grandinella]|uniref:Carboxypeptidase n=1 Tax=Halteria grandinella TaxID=5974 RepID=A0A8J8T2C6_HALGN|nr:hypothetical protein FGO68_gene13930 [Halteria grandinella]
MFKRIFISSLVVTLVASLPIYDRVCELEEMPDLSFGLYSGYIPIRNGTFKMHYITALSQSDPNNDPVVFWFNGGPGCSSLLGFAQENGPYILSDEPGATFQYNNYSWNKEATVVYLSFPIGVGFSFPCDLNNTTGDCISSDTSTASDNLNAIITFFTLKFPELLSNPLYISGESYAGIYIPYLMREIDNYLHTSLNPLPLNLKGMLIGNGLSSYQWDCIPAFLDMAVYHNLMDEELHKRVSESCTWRDLMVKSAVGNAKCDLYFDEWMEQIDKLNIYDIYSYCEQSEGNRMTMYESDSMGKQSKRRGYTDWLQDWIPKSIVGKGLPQCEQGLGVDAYFNRPSVREQLHIDPTFTQKWEMCSSNLQYHQDFLGAVSIYPQLKKSGYRILLFSGDRDGAVPTLGTKRWLQNELKWDLVERQRPYYVNRQLGGYIIEYDGLTLGTIHGAGHMAPVLRPRETYHLIFNWIQNKTI